MSERYLEIATSSMSRTLTVTPVSPVKLFIELDLYFTRNELYITILNVIMIVFLVVSLTEVSGNWLDAREGQCTLSGM